MLSNRSYLTSSQHCNLHNMSLFMARKCPGITRTRDQVVNTTGASFSFRNRKGLRVDGLDLETAETMYKTEAKCICIIFFKVPEGEEKERCLLAIRNQEKKNFFQGVSLQGHKTNCKILIKGRRLMC